MQIIYDWLLEQDCVVEEELKGGEDPEFAALNIINAIKVFAGREE